MIRRLSLLLSLTAFVPSTASSQIKALQRPKLVLVLVIDQFRADTIRRFQDRFLPPHDAKGAPGGFRFLSTEGAYFPLAEYGQLQNMTCPGHATILSGAYSYRHGIAINTWMDTETGKPVYCVEDPNSPLVGANREARGVSPRNFIGSTLGDEMKNSGLQSQVVTVAVKDRSAVLLGGYRNDLALWFDRGHWVSSRFYLPDGKLPGWVDDLNTAVAKDKNTPYSWPEETAASGHSLKNNEDIIADKFVKALGRDFPHSVPRTEVTALMTPYATKITVDAAIAALKAKKLGHGPDSDLLGVSFSEHDFLAHSYGPNSPEMESLTLEEDRAIARLLGEVDKSVGLKNTVIVLTADHGGAANPDWLKKAKVDAARLEEEPFVAQAESFLKKKLGAPKSGPWVFGSQDFNLYLNHAAIRAAGQPLERVQDQLAEYFRSGEGKTPALVEVYSAHEIKADAHHSGPLLQALVHQTYHEARSGDVILIPRPNYLPADDTTTHISGYSYDRYVPLFMYGTNIKPGVYADRAQIIDIAPTLAFLVGTTPPTGSEGHVLSQIIGEKPED